MNFGSYESSMHHNEHPSSSVLSNLNTNDVYDITSIIDSFESGNFYQSYGTSLGFLLDVNIKHELDVILHGLNTKLIPCVLNDVQKFDKKEFQESLEKIRLIKQKFSKLYKFLQATKRSVHQGNYNFVCNTCEQEVSRKNLAVSDTWCNLEQHDHFRNAFVHLLALEEEEEQCSESLNNHSNYIDPLPNTPLIMAEISKPSEMLVSETGSTSPTVSDCSVNENVISTESQTKKEVNCNNCGLQTNNLADFKFNFEITYNSTLETKMYWPRTNSVHFRELLDEIGVPFLQFKGKQLFTCLVCQCDVPSNTDISVIRQHIQGGRHIRKKSTTSIMQALCAYHENWKKQEPCYQAHQAYFLPYDVSSGLCIPCGRKGTVVPYDFLENHINSDKHRESFFRSCGKSKSRKYFDCILQLQGEVYAKKSAIALNNCEENGCEKEQTENCEEVPPSIKADEMSGEKKSVVNVNFTIKGPGCTKEQPKNSLTVLDNAESFQGNNNTKITPSKNKPENSIGTSESDITDARLNQRRTDSMVANANDVTQNNESKSNSDDHSTKSKQKHIIFKSVANRSGTELDELLEHRFLPHLKCFIMSSIHTVKCQYCKVTMPKHYKVIKDHICTKDHQINSKITNETYQFYCEICNVLLKQDKRWEDHFKLPKHVEKCEKLGASRKNNITEHECQTCKLVIFGDDLSIKRHLASAGRSGRFSKPKEIVLSLEVKNLFKSEQHIQERSLWLVGEANKVLLNQDPVRKCCLALETALAESYPNCKAYPFGSRVSGLGNENSDLDVFVDMGDMYMGKKKQDARNQEKFVIAACKIFRKKKEEFSHVNPIPTARTPIVQVYHMISKLDCDLSFRHGLSVENTKFLRLCIDLQPITQSLILILKQWVGYCKLQEHITTYALCMMVIFHLQVGGYLMPVHDLRRLHPDNVLVIDGWGVMDFSKSMFKLRDHIVPYLGSVPEMLKEFFHYYSKFNYATDVICPLLGIPIKKILFLDKPKGEDLPLEMLAYVMKVSGPDAEYFRARSPFCIQDPFDLSHNLVKACNPVVVDKLKTFCDLTLKHFTSIC